MYMPVRRSDKQHIVPSLAIVISFWEKGTLGNVIVRPHAGEKVVVLVWNVFRGEKVGPVRLEGSIDVGGICRVDVGASTVRGWLGIDPPQRRKDGRSKSLGGLVNELLLDFSFLCPGIKVEGSPLAGQSMNRTFLYRRKAIVFLPGVFGSEVFVRLPNGRTVGFPNYYTKQIWEDMRRNLLPPQVTQTVAALGAIESEVGALECDAAGEPLLRPFDEPVLLRLGLLPGGHLPQVYDTLSLCHEARVGYFQGVPEDFRLIELRLFAYDWRCDLTAAGKSLVKKLKDLQEEVRKKPDFDDEIGVAGHSTGGVIIRRALKEADMPDLVSHAFFLNTPFRGAPKALSVVLTGQSTPGGADMIPLLVDSKSIQVIALSMPIVYHLAPSAAYPGRVAVSPNRPAIEGYDVELDKSELIAAAIDCEFMAVPAFVDASTPDSDRGALAATADQWHNFQLAAHERKRAQPAYEVNPPIDYTQRFGGWYARQLERGYLKQQQASRSKGGWNTQLAEAARKFHEESEALARSGDWGDRAFIFYSLCEAETTLNVELIKEAEIHDQDLGGLAYHDNFSLNNAYFAGTATPLRSSPDAYNLPPESKVTKNSLRFHQWKRVPNKSLFTIIKWHLFSAVKSFGGDGTVTRESLLGFGGQATVLTRIRNGKKYDGDDPDHTHAPNAPFVWDTIMQIIQGTLEESRIDRSATDETGR
jgi:hypothetical protein